MSDNKMAEYLRDHPKMTGALFTMMLLLAQAGSAAAAAGSCRAGP